MVICCCEFLFCQKKNFFSLSAWRKQAEREGGSAVGLQRDAAENQGCGADQSGNCSQHQSSDSKCFSHSVLPREIRISQEPPFPWNLIHAALLKHYIRKSGGRIEK